MYLLTCVTSPHPPPAHAKLEHIACVARYKIPWVLWYAQSCQQTRDQIAPKRRQILGLAERLCHTLYFASCGFHNFLSCLLHQALTAPCKIVSYVFMLTMKVESNLNDSNIFGTMKVCSRYW